MKKHPVMTMPKMHTRMKRKLGLATHLSHKKRQKKPVKKEKIRSENHADVHHHGDVPQVRQDDRKQ